ncbi:hypothetical protein CGZ93_14200 [Enemella dayhoffiae]|uniref:Serine protease n=1 Tax=Enemella dayhoffiae TaxID=2016507 RepID=A0A255GSJ3_9ACTN|nr:trypsin-like peptidase domain-containing protein [Enemella dayhoffiae]OYO18580.1 hypothetical protein CGZ93_14200 [Enemella dayhoffiae]
MDRCPNCQAQVTAAAPTCPNCGLPRRDEEATAIHRAPSPQTHLAEPTEQSRGPRARAMIPVTAGLLVLAVIAGILTAFQLRGQNPFGSGPAASASPGTSSATSPPGPTPRAPTPPVAPDPPEPTLDGAWAEVAARADGSVRRVIASTCSGTGIGSAYAVGPDTLATAWHSVAGARSVGVVDAAGVVSAEVVKVQPEANLALLRTARPLGAPALSIGTRPLAVGDEALVLGRSARGPDPLRGRPAARTGQVQEVGQRAPAPEGEAQISRMGGEFDPGLAGAPVLGRDGTLLGMVIETAPDQTNPHQFQLAELGALIDPLLGPTGQPPPPAGCPHPAGPKFPPTVTGGAPEPTRAAIGRLVAALNAGRLDEAYAQLDGEAKQTHPREGLARDWTGRVVVSAQVEPDGAEAVATLTVIGTGCQRYRVAVSGEQLTRWQQAEFPGC